MVSHSQCRRVFPSTIAGVAPTVEIPAVILAAGFGRRIAELTNGGPKALLELGGRSLLERELEALAAAGFGRVVVVTGHEAERIRGRLPARLGQLTIEERWNPAFATTNNIVSMLAADDLLAEGFCLLNSDIVFEPSILAEVAGVGPGSWLVVDGDEPLGAEEMKVHLDGTGVVRRISKHLDPATSAGEYIGILRLDDRGARVVLDTARGIVAGGGTNLYYEDAIDAAAEELAARPVWTRLRGWTEIDDAADYRRAVDVAAAIDRSATP